MSDIDDDGKIWLRGSFRPEYGVRVGELYFVTGKEDDENIHCFIYGNYLLVDLNNPGKQQRVIRRLALDLEPQSSGTLFNGFTKTKHCDIKAVTYRDNGVDEFKSFGENYLMKNDDFIDPIRMMQLAGWK